MKKILVTGASGFLGVPIVKALAESGQYKVYAVISGRRAVSFPLSVNVLTADLLNSRQTAVLIEEIRPEIMLHLAWELSGPGYFNAARNLTWLEASLGMLRIFAAGGGQYFAFAGSSAEYKRFKGFSESGEAAEISLYGQSKNIFHQAAVKLSASAGVGYVNLRFFPVLGAGVNASIAAPAIAADAFAKGSSFTCKAPYNIWDFISIADASKAACETIRQRYGGVVNIGSGIPRMMGDVFRLIADKMGCGRLLHLDYENKSKEILVADTGVLNRVIGYNCITGLDEMLDEMISAV